MLTNKKRAAHSLFFSLAALVLLAGCTPRGPRALLDGRRLVEQGKYADAVERLKVATSLLATNANAWNYLGLAYHGAGQLTNAADAYQRALRVNHDLVEARYNLGSALLDQNKLEAAKEQLTIFTMRRPNSLEGWAKLATAQLRARDLAAAEKSFNEVLRLNSQSPEAFNGLGLVALQRNRPLDAAQSFNAALKARPDYAPALLNLAVVSQQQLNNRRLALQKYREYLALQPRPANAEAVGEIVKTLEREFAPTPARPMATNTSALVASATPAPKPAPSPPTNIVRPAPAVSAPKPEPATNAAKPAPPPPPRPAPPVEATSKVEVVKVPEPVIVKPAQDISLSPPPARTGEDASTLPPPLPRVISEPKPEPDKPGFFQRMNPANLFRREPKPAPAVTPLARSAATNSASTSSSNAAATKPGEPRMIARYAYRPPAKLEAGNRSAAERALAQGVQAQSQSRLHEAMMAFRAATKADASFFKAQYNLGWTAFELGDSGQALSAYETALVIEPGSVDARYNFAVALQQANYPIDAANELEKILSGYPNEARAHLLLASLYAEQLGQPKKARVHYLRVLEIEPGHPRGTDIRYWLAAHPE